MSTSSTRQKVTEQARITSISMGIIKILEQVMMKTKFMAQITNQDIETEDDYDVPTISKKYLHIKE